MVSESDGKNPSKSWLPGQLHSVEHESLEAPWMRHGRHHYDPPSRYPSCTAILETGDISTLGQGCENLGGLAFDNAWYKILVESRWTQGPPGNFCGLKPPIHQMLRSWDVLRTNRSSIFSGDGVQLAITKERAWIS